MNPELSLSMRFCDTGIYCQTRFSIINHQIVNSKRIAARRLLFLGFDITSYRSLVELLGPYLRMTLSDAVFLSTDLSVIS